MLDTLADTVATIRPSIFPETVRLCQHPRKIIYPKSRGHVSEPAKLAFTGAPATVFNTVVAAKRYQVKTQLLTSTSQGTDHLGLTTQHSAVKFHTYR
jgi:hypothetical protein